MATSVFSKISSFLKTESSFDALRNILIILIPSLFVFYLFDGHVAIAFAVGVLLACLTDLPGTKKDKWTSFAYCIPVFAITSISISLALANHSPIIVLLLGIFGFVYTFIALLGFRINFIGNLGLIVASFTIGLRPEDPLIFSLSVTAGAICFYILSLLQVYLFPYRSLRFAVQSGITSLSQLIRLKIDCYNEEIPLPKTYKQLSALQIKVSDQLEAVRSLLLRNKNLHSEKDFRTKIWLAKLYKLIDLYEFLMAVDQDYERIRELLKSGNTLSLIRRALAILSKETAALNYLKKSKSSNLKRKKEFEKIMVQLEVDQFIADFHRKELIISIAKQLGQIANILHEIKEEVLDADHSWVESKNFKDFVAPDSDFKTLVNNFNFKSPIFSYAARMSILLMLGGIIGYALPEYRYASWILLTIILVARPSFTTTQKRNYQRIVGSLIGIAISLLILLIIKDFTILMGIAIFCLYLFLLFNKPNYLVCVIFITITILIGQHTFEGTIQDILGSRFAFTLMGSIFAVLGCLAIPINHYRSIEQQTNRLLDHFRNFFQKIKESYEVQELSYYDLRLVRKFTQSALALSYDSLEQFAKDPIQGRLHKKEIEHFQTLAYRINALLVGLSINRTKLGFVLHPELMNERTAYIDTLIAEAETLSKKLHKNKERPNIKKDLSILNSNNKR